MPSHGGSCIVHSVLIFVLLPARIGSWKLRVAESDGSVTNLGVADDLPEENMGGHVVCFHYIAPDVAGDKKISDRADLCVLFTAWREGGSDGEPLAVGSGFEGAEVEWLGFHWIKKGAVSSPALVVLESRFNPNGEGFPAGLGDDNRGSDS